MYNFIKTVIDKSKKLIGAQRKSKVYGHIVPLGYNCEIAYRFYRNYKFIDSSLFAWVYIESFEALLEALKNPQNVGAGEFEYENTMFRCLNSGIYFHGQSKPSDFTGSEEEIKQLIDDNKIELRQRISYLKDKFKKYLSDGEKNLYIKKVSKLEVNDDNFSKNINDLYKFLKENCKNEFDMLVVTEEDFPVSLTFDNPQIITRQVKKFSPDEDVTNKNMGDEFGWKVIFTEFKPKYKVLKKKKLKFEEV